MNNSLVKERFSLPEAWNMTLLEDVTSQIIDGTHHTPTYTDFGVPFLRVTDIQSKELDITKLKFVSEKEHQILKKRCFPKKGDLLLSKNGTIGIPKVVDWDWEFSVFVSLALIKPIPKRVDVNFLAHFLKSDLTRWQVLRRAKQGTVSNLHLEEIREFEIPDLELSHQKIVAKILTTCDEVIENTEKTIAKYKAIRQGMMQDLFTRGIDIKTGKLRSKYQDAPELYHNSGLGWIPKEWCEKKLFECGDIISGGTPSREINEYWVDGEIPWATPSDITKNEDIELLDTKEKISPKGLYNSSAKLLPTGSLLMTSRATLAEIKINTIETTTNQGFKSIVCNKKTNNWFLYYFMKYSKTRYESFGIGTTFLEVNKKDTDNFLIKRPSLKEQEVIGERLKLIDEKIKKETITLAKQKSIKQGLMQDLLTGKVEVEIKEVEKIIV